MLTGSSIYNQRLTQSREPRKIASPPKTHKCRTLEKQQQLPQMPLTELPFDSSDHSQTFYRFSEKTMNQMKTIKLGWRIVELSLDQVDLAIFCLSLLQGKLNYPLKFYCPSRSSEGKVGNEIYRDVWIEWTILAGASRD